MVNQTRTMPDQKLGGFMASAARRRLGHSLEYLGHVESDETVWLAARRGDHWSRSTPTAKRRRTSNAWGGACCPWTASASASARSTAPLRPEEEQTYYEILETEPGVSDEEIRRAYRTVKDNYASGSMVIAGLYEEHELAALHARINAAHDTLFSPDRRRLYDLALPEADLARAVRAAAPVRRPPGRPTAPRGASRSRRGLDRPGGRGDRGVPAKVRESKGIELARSPAHEDQRALPARHRR